MGVTRLTTRRVDKPWGRRDLLPAFGDVAEDAEPVGEIWFEDPRGGDPALLVKYLFTCEKLSIQVHPDDALAHANGLASGKDEAWLVLSTEPAATIGLGLRTPCDAETLRSAALDGSIEEMIDWRPASAGDSYYSPAGTIHSLGAGLKLIEVQQNADITYRLYDFGRPRELHLDDAIAAAAPEPYTPPFTAFDAEPGRRILAAGRKFVLERWSMPRAARLKADPQDPVWIIPIDGAATLDGQAVAPGEVWLAEDDCTLVTQGGADLLIAYQGAELREGISAAGS